MLTAKRKPTTVGEILTQSALARAMGVQRKYVNELSPDFWLNAQRRHDLWAVMNTPKERERVERARPLKHASL